METLSELMRPALNGPVMHPTPQVSVTQISMSHPQLTLARDQLPR